MFNKNKPQITEVNIIKSKLLDILNELYGQANDAIDETLCSLGDKKKISYYDGRKDAFELTIKLIKNLIKEL